MKAIDKKEAEAERVKWMLMKNFVKNDDCAIEIVINANNAVLPEVRLGVSDNETLMLVIDNEIKQINNFLEGKPNTWE